MPDLFVGVDLGGTNIKAGLVSTAGEVLHRHRIPTRSELGPEGVVQRIAEAVRACIREAERRGGAVRGVGVGSPGTIDLGSGVILFSPNMPGWRDIPLRSMAEKALGVPCRIANDANVAALGEQWVGAGRGARSLVLLTLGTGIGGGIVTNGRIWEGATGVAGEIGHMCINPDGPACGCGSRGCLEAYASATAMVRRLREAMEQGAQSALAARAADLTARDIHEAALAGDAVARANVEATGRYLGVGVSNILHILNPEVVAFSGGVTAAGDMLMGPCLEEVRRRTLEASRAGVRICFSQLPEDAGVIGAARYVMLD